MAILPAVYQRIESGGKRWELCGERLPEGAHCIQYVDAGDEGMVLGCWMLGESGPVTYSEGTASRLCALADLTGSELIHLFGKPDGRTLYATRLRHETFDPLTERPDIDSATTLAWQVAVGIIGLCSNESPSEPVWKAYCQETENHLAEHGVFAPADASLAGTLRTMWWDTATEGMFYQSNQPLPAIKLSEGEAVGFAHRIARMLKDWMRRSDADWQPIS